MQEALFYTVAHSRPWPVKIVTSTGANREKGEKAEIYNVLDGLLPDGALYVLRKGDIITATVCATPESENKYLVKFKIQRVTITRVSAITFERIPDELVMPELAGPVVWHFFGFNVVGQRHGPVQIGRTTRLLPCPQAT